MRYDLEYYEKMLRLNSSTAKQICDIRWEWVMNLKPKTVLDFGSGVGWFRAWRPENVEVYSHDIGPYPQTRAKLIYYDVMCLWDVFEHIPDFRELKPYFSLTDNVVGTIPLKPDHVSWQDWKHFKPSEHLHYLTKDQLIILFDEYGFKPKNFGYPECPPREDILTFHFQKRVI